MFLTIKAKRNEISLHGAVSSQSMLHIAVTELPLLSKYFPISSVFYSTIFLVNGRKLLSLKKFLYPLQ